MTERQWNLQNADSNITH